MILWQLFSTFFKIGLFTFGGGYAMLPLIQSEVAAHAWMEQAQLVNFIAVSESTPGPFAINIATYIGTTTGGVLGAICATLGVVLPSFLVILVLAHFLTRFQNSRAVKGCLAGLKPAVIGLIGSALLSVGGTVFFPNGWTSAVFTTAAFYVSLGLFLLCAVLAFKKVHPILLICLSAGVGIAAGYALGL